MLDQEKPDNLMDWLTVSLKSPKKPVLLDCIKDSMFLFWELSPIELSISEDMIPERNMSSQTKKPPPSGKDSSLLNSSPLFLELLHIPWIPSEEDL